MDFNLSMKYIKHMYFITPEQRNIQLYMNDLKKVRDLIGNTISTYDPNHDNARVIRKNYTELLDKELSDNEFELLFGTDTLNIKTIRKMAEKSSWNIEIKPHFRENKDTNLDELHIRPIKQS